MPSPRVGRPDACAAAGAGIVALLALCAASPSAQAAATPIAAERLLIDFKGKGRTPDTLSFRLQGNCMDISALPGWVVEFDGLKGIWGSADLDATGSIDVARRRGSVKPKARGAGLLFRTLFRDRGDGGPSLKLTEIGLELAGSRAYLTGRLSRSSAHLSAGRVRRVGLIRKPKLLMGQLHAPGRAKRDIADTFAIALQGTVVLTKVFARELDRRRCHEWASQGAGRVRAGRKIGRLTAQLATGAATGLSGTLPAVVDFSTTADEPVRLAVADGNGSPLALDDYGVPTATLATVPGSRTALGCVILDRYPGQRCAPFGGVMPLAGALVLSTGGRSTTLSDLSIAYGSDARSDSFPSRTLSGSVDGVPFALSSAPAGDDSLSPLPEALVAIGAALGVEVQGGVFPDDPTFAGVGPP